MKNMIPATNGKSIYIPAQRDWRSRRYDEASTLDEIVLSLSGPCASVSLPRLLADKLEAIVRFPSDFETSAHHMT